MKKALREAAKGIKGGRKGQQMEQRTEQWMEQRISNNQGSGKSIQRYMRKCAIPNAWSNTVLERIPLGGQDLNGNVKLQVYLPSDWAASMVLEPALVAEFVAYADPGKGACTFGEGLPTKLRFFENARSIQAPLDEPLLNWPSWDGRVNIRHELVAKCWHSSGSFH